MKKIPLIVTVITGVLIMSCSTGTDTKMYDVTVSVSPAEAGSISPTTDSTYEEGRQITLSADPSESFAFSGWSGDVDTSSNPLSITVDDNYSLTANFEKKTYQLTTTAEGDGSISEEIVQDNSKDYEHGTVVELTANASEGWEFEEWQGDLTSSENPKQITIDEPKDVTAVFSNSTFSGGSGTEDNPFEISTIEQLQAIESYPNSHFIQTNNIDASATSSWNGGRGFNPIGDDIIKFTGSFDGSGYEIQNITINRPDKEYVALFGYVDNGSEIINANLISVKIKGDFSVGGLVGYVGFESDTLENLHVSGNISGYGYVGGLVGYHTGTVINNSSTKGIISGTAQIGGLVGDNRGKIKKSFSEADVSGERFVGGLVGFNYQGIIIISKSIGTVTGTEEIGGLVGKNNESTIRGSYALGQIEGEESIGGLVGLNEGGGSVVASYTTGQVIGTNNVGGLVGTNGANLTDNYWDTEATNQTDGIGRGISDGATGLTTSQMTGDSAEDNMSGFDFTEIWVTTDSYPELFWE